MNAYVAPSATSTSDPKPHGRAPWIALGVLVVGVVLLMEGVEALGMAGYVSLDLANAIAVPLMPVLATIPLVMGIRAIRAGATGHPWIPTIVSGLLVVALVINLLMALVSA